MSWRSFTLTASALCAVASAGLAQAPAPSDPVADLQRQVDALRRELAELKAEKAAEKSASGLEREVSDFSSRLQEEGGGTVTAPNAGKITLGGSYRARIHYARNRDFNNGGGNDDDYTTHRLRVNAGVDIDEHTKLFAQIRSAFLWGTQSGSFAAEVPNGEVALHQGYADFTDLMGSGWNLRLGRQEFIYGDERILSNIDWEEFGRVWDGAKVSTKYDDLGVDFLWAKSAESFGAFPAATTGSDIDLYGVWITYAGAEDFSVDVHVLPIEDRSVESLFVHIGARARGKFEMFDFGAEVDAVRDRGDGDLSHVTFNESYLLAADAGLNFSDVEGKPRVGVSWSRGTSSYLPVVPDLHRYAGLMDVVTPFSNLIDWEGNVSISPVEEWTLSGSYHVFQFEETPGTASGKSLGQELDLVLAGACTDHLRVEVGYGHFFPREGFDAFETGGLTPGTSLAFNPWTPIPTGKDANDTDLIWLQFDVPF
ncbi:MAG TPA: alginate export family protein [Planctomycetota bacterium]|nr:alginate export family protein [Planctomycetota bacterium]